MLANQVLSRASQFKQQFSIFTALTVELSLTMQPPLHWENSTQNSTKDKSQPATSTTKNDHFLLELKFDTKLTYAIKLKKT